MKTAFNVVGVFKYSNQAFKSLKRSRDINNSPIIYTYT
jgi:hypothetical protein